MRTSVTALCIAVVALFSGMADLRAQPEEHVPAGARVALELDRAEYFIGENVLAHFVLENAGSEPFTFTWGGDYRGSNRHRRLQVTAAREDGTPAEVGDRGLETEGRRHCR